MADKPKSMQDQFKEAKFVSDYKRDVTAPKGKGPTVLTKDEKETVQLSNERARNPKEFDAAKSMYESAMKQDAEGKKKGGKVKCMAAGGSASTRADGIAVRGKTRGTIC
jgi:hypothetical protein